MNTIRRVPPLALFLCFAALVAGGPGLHAQLRPLEPIEWNVLREEGTLSVRVGAGVHHRQKASLAGLEGSLLEVGETRLEWRTGRVMIEAGGTILRILSGYQRFAEPTGGARLATGERLLDSGAWRVATVVGLTRPDSPAVLALRFGTRLPSPDNRVGLDRDQTDFFVLVGGQVRRNGFSLGTEIGLGINGTRDPEYEQSDVVLYTAVAEYRRGAIVPRLSLMGQYDGNRRIELRGNEDLSELRMGVRAGRRWWIDAELVRGLVAFSPASGLRVGAGTRR